MYIDKLHLKNIRTFVDDTLVFIHPETEFKDPAASDEVNAGRLAKPRLANVNLLLGENGAGKTTVLQAIALASLGPAAPIAQLPLPRFVRFDVNNSESQEFGGHMIAQFQLHEQGIEATGAREIHLELMRHLELEELHLGHYSPACLNEEYTATIIERSQKGEPLSEKTREIIAFLVNEVNQIGNSTNDSRTSSLRRDFAKFVLQFEFEKRGLLETWERVHDSKNPAFFCVAYGATRRIDPGDGRSPATRRAVSFLRGTRLQSIFEDGFSLYPLRYWLPAFKTENPERYTEILNILNSLISDENCRLTGEERDGDLLFERHGLKLPLYELSDGYRAFIAWVADLLYHLSYACPREQSLLDCRGIVLVDEIDLHLHPRWQMKVVSTIANAFPKMQFIFTSHSPLIVGSVEWMNILTLQTDPATNETDIKRFRQSVHGLDPDQILLSDFFGLESTTGALKQLKIDELTTRIRSGDKTAALQLAKVMNSGLEADE